MRYARTILWIASLFVTMTLYIMFIERELLFFAGLMLGIGAYLTFYQLWENVKQERSDA